MLRPVRFTHERMATAHRYGPLSTAMGATSWAFINIFGFPAVDASFSLLAFLFLVAFGVDYNIFLVGRARQETTVQGPRQGILIALAVTGGVITSAGVVLAATFGVLTVLPLLFLTEDRHRGGLRRVAGHPNC